jgi:multiple sugar transport system permease protein
MIKPVSGSFRGWLYGSGIVVLCVWVLLPIGLIGLGAFGGRPAVYQWPKTLLPGSLSLDQLTVFLKIEGVWNSALNSLMAASMTMVMALLLGAPAGYALARFSFPGSTVFRLMILLTRAFPLAILALPLTVLFIRAGLYDTAFGVSLVHTALALPFAVMITTSLFAGIPRELEEAAWVFGCSRSQAFVKIVLPMALPGMVAAAIFAFVISWNEVFAASVLTVQQRTLTAYLLTVLSESPLHYRFAGGFILIVPSVVFIFAVRRYLFALWGVTNR